MNSTPDNEQIDEWASRLIDGDITIDDVAPSLRDEVRQRAVQFRDVRTTLLQSRVDDMSNIDSVVNRALGAASSRRRVSTYLVGLAAAAAVATIVGVAVSSTSSSNQSADVPRVVTDAKVANSDPVAMSVEAAPAATEAPLSGSGAPNPSAGADIATADGVVDACPDDRRPTIVPVAIINGETTEIHWSAVHGLVIYRISDCSIVLAPTP